MKLSAIYIVVKIEGSRLIISYLFVDLKFIYYIDFLQKVKNDLYFLNISKKQ